MRQAWLAPLLTFALLSGPALAAEPRFKTDVFRTAADFSHARGLGTRLDQRVSGWRLQDHPEGGYLRSGTVTLGDLHYGWGFREAVVSWNADCPPGTWIRLEAAVSPDGGETWSDWLELARWGDSDTLSWSSTPRGPSKHDLARVNEDTLEPTGVADRLRVRATLCSDRPGSTPVLELVAVAATNRQAHPEPDDRRGAAWGKEVRATHRAQSLEKADRSYRVCGPTSAAMALAAHGVVLPTQDVARRCWDAVNGIYGNWPFLAAAASDVLRGTEAHRAAAKGREKAHAAWVAWPPDWKGVEDEVAAGRPCIVSIRFKEGELPGAPTASSAGHLILVTGFTAKGDPIALDPAARRPEAGRIVYGRQALHRARHGGPVIVVHPHE
ncbi:MAG: C39 family peptidase [Candidatus Sericytochromatia bacterium]|nr:C39 family peptidase [Candidatus Sericytochromatia bacterium]